MLDPFIEIMGVTWYFFTHLLKLIIPTFFPILLRNLKQYLNCQCKWKYSRNYKTKQFHTLFKLNKTTSVGQCQIPSSIIFVPIPLSVCVLKVAPDQNKELEYVNKLTCHVNEIDHRDVTGHLYVFISLRHECAER